MWLTHLVVAAAETPPASPPDVPYETIGVVLVAIVGAISAVIIATIQRGNRTGPPTVAPAPTGPTANQHTVSENEWITARDRGIRTELSVDNLRTEFGYHEKISADHINRVNRDIAAIKRKLEME